MQELGIKDEFEVWKAVGELEETGKAVLSGFRTDYREDGGAIHLAEYTGTVQHS